MFDLYMTVRSVTRGQKGSDALGRAGIGHRLLRAPRSIAPGGCAYALALARRDGTGAVGVLDRAGVTVEERWLREPGGAFRRWGQ